MKFLNHYTVNSGNFRQSFPSEVKKETLITLKKIIQEAKNNQYADMLDNTKLEITTIEGGYVLTIYGVNNEQLFPILFSAGCSDSKKSTEVWKNVETIYEKIFGERINTVPMTPYIADIILPYSALFLPVLKWTGDFSKCIGWALLAPEEIV